MTNPYTLTPLTQAFVDIGAAIVLESDPPKVRSTLDDIPMEQLVAAAINVDGYLTTYLPKGFRGDAGAAACSWAQAPGPVREAAARAVVEWERAEREASRREARAQRPSYKRPGSERERWHRRIQLAVIQASVDLDPDPKPAPPEEATAPVQAAYIKDLKRAYDLLCGAEASAHSLRDAGLDALGAHDMHEHGTTLNAILRDLHGLIPEEAPDE